MINGLKYNAILQENQKLKNELFNIYLNQQ